MAKSSIHIGIGQSGYIAHNSRESWSKSQVFFDEENEIWNNKENAFKLFRSELAARSAAYSERTKQKLQKSAKTHLSAIINLNKNHTLYDLTKIADYIEKEFDTKVFQMSIHRDEGKLVNKFTGDILTSGEQFFCNPKTRELFFDEAYTKKINMNEWRMEKNYHAHIEFLGLNSDGQSLKKRMSTWHLRKMQDFVSESLNMERGQKTKSYSKEQMKLIKSGIKKKNEYNSDKEYGQAFTARAKELGIWIDKKGRKDTHQYKAKVATENKAKIEARIEGDKRIKDNNFLHKFVKTHEIKKEENATIAKLKKEIKDAKAELQGVGAEREQHAQLEQLNKELKEKIRSHDLVMSVLKTEVAKMKEALMAEIATLKAEKEALELTVTTKTNENTSLKVENDALKAKIATLPSKSTLEELELENTTLKAKNDALKAIIATLPSKDTLTELNTLKIDFKVLENENIKLKAEKTEEKSALTLKLEKLERHGQEELEVSENLKLLQSLGEIESVKNIENEIETMVSKELASKAIKKLMDVGIHKNTVVGKLKGEPKPELFDDSEPVSRDSDLVKIAKSVHHEITAVTMRVRLMFEALVEVFKSPCKNLEDGIEKAEPIQNKKVKAEKAKVEAHYKKQFQNLNQVDSYFYER